MQAATLVVTGLLLSAASHAATAEPSRALHCRSVTDLGPLLETGSTLLLGEMHGVAETPAMARDAVCLGLAAGLHVTLALELPVEESTLVDGLVAAKTPDTRALARRSLLSGAFWSKPYQDGRASVARLALLEDVGAWHADGLPVRVVSFDTGVPAGMTPATAGAARDQAMAEALARAIGEAPRDLVVVLVGNVHSRVAAGVPWDPNYEPMGLRLHRLLPERKATALDVAYGEGAAWMCTTGEPSSCGERRLGGTAGTPAGSSTASAARPVTVRLYSGIREGHDGVYDVGVLTPSRPARQGLPATRSRREK